MECDCLDYNDHYDRTALKGLCWECHVNRAHTYVVPGTKIKGESLWCLGCQVKLGMIAAESQAVN